ncbi:hypothetical protein [Clostridium felsineum]|uniref:hypothetical protein n=1 Tax=Clostridium felsineum TaxID=36839 RepID=UPI00098C4AC4|nr:hypothetical protein [Clostridium felsineum]URZ15535.1 hypothetical protein CLFE_015750 [Clostridium felsineum DSM 794]
MLKNFVLKNKKIFILAFSAFLIILYADYRINLSKRSDITYAANYYMTSGIFNTHKLYKIDSYTLKFASTDESILFVSGIESKSPHKTVTYKLTMLKTYGIWKLKHIEQANSLN